MIVLAVLAIAVVALAVSAADAVAGLGFSSNLSGAIRTLCYACAAALAFLRAGSVRHERTAWLVLGGAIGLWVPAELYHYFHLQHLASPPYPSIADYLWLSSYIGMYAAMMLLVRTRIAKAHRSVWLDGLTAALTAGAVVAAFVFSRVLHNLGGSDDQIATNLAYPICDLLLLGFIAVVAALSGWRPGRRWLMLGAGILLLVFADSAYLVKSADGTYDTGSLLDLVWPLSFLVIAISAWQQPEAAGERASIAGARVLFLPSVLGTSAGIVLVYDHFVRTNVVAVGLAAATLALVMMRTVLTFREVQHLHDSRRLSLTDELTGLPNRRSFFDTLDAALSQATPASDPLAVLMIDLDRFKELNDTLGHHAGDRVLTGIGPRLRFAVRGDDRVARLGGDEFAILASGRGTGGDIATRALAVAERCRAVLREPFDLDGVAIHLDASIGISLYPAQATTAAGLMQRADIAMYDAKRARIGAAVYAPERDGHSRDRLALVGELRGAIANGELELHYQPKAMLDTREVTAAEALVRWRHPRRGLLMPGDFLPAAEQTQLMRELTRTILDGALQEAASWARHGSPLDISVNLSAADLIDADLPAEVASVLERHGVPATRLVLEITESVLMGDSGRAQHVLSEIRALGVRVALDDFGTGYSSLAHLKQLPIDQLKIDRSFVAGLADDDADADIAIVRSTIDLGHALGLRIVAEGVETEAVWERLEELGADAAQGFWLSPPLPGPQLVAWLAARESQAATLSA